MFKINHIGVVVRDITESIEYYTKLFGYCLEGNIIIDEIQKSRIQFIQSEDGTTCIELIEPLTKDSPVANALSNGGGLNHICYEVDDIDDTILTFKIKGCRLISGPVPANAFGGRRIAFMFSKQFEIIEFVEKEDV